MIPAANSYLGPVQRFQRKAKIIDEFAKRLLFFRGISKAQNRRRMFGRKNPPWLDIQNLPAHAGKHDRLTFQGTRGGDAEGDDKSGANDIQLAIEPPAAGLDFAPRRLLVQPELASLLMFEMFDRVCDVTRRSVKAGLGQRLIEHMPRWTDERFAGKVFFISGLFADKHDRAHSLGLRRRQFASHRDKADSVYNAQPLRPRHEGGA